MTYAALLTVATYLVTPKSYLPQFLDRRDREYYSKPVRVILFTSIAGRQLMAIDPARGRQFPVSPKNIVREHQLTNAQRAAVAAEGGQ